MVGHHQTIYPKSVYAVIFTSLRTSADEGYADMSDFMVELAARQPGFLSVESARSEIGITVSYWESLEAIRQWKMVTDHQLAQEKGREKWYQWYRVRVCKVEKAYGFGE